MMPSTEVFYTVAEIASMGKGHHIRNSNGGSIFFRRKLDCIAIVPTHVDGCSVAKSAREQKENSLFRHLWWDLMRSTRSKNVVRSHRHRRFFDFEESLEDVKLLGLVESNSTPTGISPLRAAKLPRRAASRELIHPCETSAREGKFELRFSRTTLVSPSSRRKH